ncbi:MAG: hypothetical protein ABI954_00795 [Pyrinomonadaceae bacterium]
MNRNTILFSVTSALALITLGCGGAANENATVNANANSNTAVVIAANTVNPTTNVTPPQVGNSSIPGIPNVPGTEKPVSKEDPTRNAKVQTVSRPGADNSEIFGPTLGADVVETRVFKNNAQIAKIEVIGINKKTVKVYLRNGQVRELPEGKVGDPLSESAANILKALAGSAPPAKPESKPTPQTETPDLPKKQ